MIQDIRHELLECGGEKNGKCEMNWVECGGYLDLKMRWVDFEGYVDVFEPPYSFFIKFLTFSRKYGAYEIQSLILEEILPNFKDSGMISPKKRIYTANLARAQLFVRYS